CPGGALAGGGGAHGLEFALGFEFGKSLLNSREQSLKGVQVHAGDGQKELGAAGGVVIKVHRDNSSSNFSSSVLISQQVYYVMSVSSKNLLRLEDTISIRSLSRQLFLSIASCGIRTTEGSSPLVVKMKYGSPDPSRHMPIGR